jgi:hypothetical protein
MVITDEKEIPTNRHLEYYKGNPFWAWDIDGEAISEHTLNKWLYSYKNGVWTRPINLPNEKDIY